MTDIEALVDAVCDAKQDLKELKRKYATELTELKQAANVLSSARSHLIEAMKETDTEVTKGTRDDTECRLIKKRKIGKIEKHDLANLIGQDAASKLATAFVEKDEEQFALKLDKKKK